MSNKSTALEKWWFPTSDYRGRRPSVWLFGGAGVEQAWTANPLIPLVGDYDFAVWRMPGRSVRKDEPDPTSLRAVGREIAESIAEIGAVRPVLSGLSFGGLLAFVATQELEKLGVQVGRFVPIVSACPNEWRMGAVYAWLNGGPVRYTKRRLAAADKAGKLPPELSGANREVMQRPYVADLTAGFREWSHSVIKTSITDISASDEQRLHISNLTRWRPYTRGEFDSITSTGGHFFYREHPEVVSRVFDRESEIAYSGGF
ncbi:thioesterase II family protein [Nocardia jiangxiensis]|uniref:Thioesterase II family protein n=1 Tax=Nocardia jiangxiensis TaxID=282685 RepID=A0ABW6S1M4_9NOCA